MISAQLLALAPVLLLAAAALAGDRITGEPFATRSEAIARHGMAATSQPLATQAALDVLKAGGSAVDAAIAANAVLCLTEPTGCGLGGDLFGVINGLALLPTDGRPETLRLWGLDGIDEVDYEPRGALSAELLDANRGTLDNVRLWDWQVLLDYFEQKQSIRPYYDFRDVDIDRYPTADGIRQVELAWT